MRRILHISDVHFGPHFLPQVGEGLLGLIAAWEPDFVALSGDLTQRAKPRQFRQARAFVDRIEVPTLAVPGNHDVPLYRFWERLLVPYGAYRKHYSRELEPVYRDEEMLVVGVNTAYNWTIKNGRITSAALRRVERLFSEAPAELARLVVLHHELVPAPRFGSQAVLRRAREAVALFAELGVELVLAGHLHQAYVGTSEAYYPSGRRPVLIAHSGTTTSDRGRGSERRRNSCNLVVIDDEEISVSHLGWRSKESRFVEWSRHRYPRRGLPSYELSSALLPPGDGGALSEG